jgi:hypothetical protein
MKKVMVVIAILSIGGILSSVAGAKSTVTRFDWKEVKCQQHTKISTQNLKLALVWLNGYLAGTKNTPILDLQQAETFGGALVRYCKENPTASVFEAFEKVTQDKPSETSNSNNVGS